MNSLATRTAAESCKRRSRRSTWSIPPSCSKRCTPIFSSTPTTNMAVCASPSGRIEAQTYRCTDYVVQSILTSTSEKHRRRVTEAFMGNIQTCKLTPSALQRLTRVERQKLSLLVQWRDTSLPRT